MRKLVSVNKLLERTGSNMLLEDKVAVVTGAVDTYEVDRTQTRCVVRLSIPAFLSLLLMGAGIYH